MNGVIPLIMMIGTAITVFCMCRSGEDTSQDEALAEIEKLHRTDMAAAKVNDIETLRTLWTDDCVLLQPDQEPIKGREAMWAYMQEALEEQKQYEITEYVHDFEEIEVLGDWAYEWGTFRGAYRPVSGGEEIRERARLFRILKRQPDGSWKCARAIWHQLSVGEEGDSSKE